LLLDNGVARHRKRISRILARNENGSFAISFNRVCSVCTCSVCTLHSAGPFLAGCPGAINFWKSPFCPQYNLNWSLTKTVALSDTMTCSYNGWMPLKLAEVSALALCRSAIHEGSHSHHRHVPLERKKWRYACRILRTSSLKEGSVYF
jgi:hypothetical protein